MVETNKDIEHDCRAQESIEDDVASMQDGVDPSREPSVSKVHDGDESYKPLNIPNTGELSTEARKMQDASMRMNNLAGERTAVVDAFGPSQTGKTNINTEVRTVTAENDATQNIDMPSTQPDFRNDPDN